MIIRMQSRTTVWLLLCILATGCRSQHCHDCSGIRTVSRIDPLTVLPESDSASVSASFDGIDLSEPQQAMSFFDSPPLAVTLDEAICLAARNSRLAGLVDRERKAICCEAGCLSCVDVFLQTQAQEQRVKSAVDAGELLIRLAGIQMQSELLQASKSRIAELMQTLKVADENGLATANTESELNKQRITVERKQVELDAGVFEINSKLNFLLGMDSCYPRQILPRHHFDTHLADLELDRLVIQALSHRPETQALSAFGSCSDQQQCLSILSKLDSRLGLDLSNPVSRCLLRLRDNDPDECCCRIRQEQIQEIRGLNEERIRQEVLEQAKNVLLEHENMKMENAELRRLELEDDLIDSASELNPKQSFVDSISNFAEQQLAKSKRIAALVEYEVAKLRLDAATGSIDLDSCGLPGIDKCSCRIE